MSFVDFFRKKWKHSDPEVRAEAVRDLDIEAELAEVLRTDSDVRVRRIALKRVADPEVLSQVAESDSDDALRRAAAEKATTLLLDRALLADDEPLSLAALRRLSQPRALAEVAKSSPLDPVRRAALGRLSDDKSLSDVARNAKDAAVRKGAVDRIAEPSVLRDIAISETARELGVAALSRIDDVTLLESIARRARNKQVAAAARERLPQTAVRADKAARAPEEISPEARRRARQAQLIREMEHAIGLGDLAEAEHAAQALTHAWHELGKNPEGDDYQKKMDKVLERFAIRKRTLEEAHRAHVQAHAHADTHGARPAAPAAAVEEDRAVIEARTALCVRVESLDGEGARGAVEETRAAWQDLPRLVGPKGKELEIRFRKAVDAAARRSELSMTKEQLQEKLEAVVLEAEGLVGPIKEVEPQLRALRRRLTDLEAAGHDEALRARLRRVEERVEAEKAELVRRRAAEEAEAVTRLEELVTRLEGLVESTDRKKLEGELKVAHSAFESTRARGPAIAAVRARYTAARDKAAAQAQELRDAENWKRWANVPQLERLCEQMESIARALAREQQPTAHGLAEAGDAEGAAVTGQQDGGAAPAEAQSAPAPEVAAAAPAPEAAVASVEPAGDTAEAPATPPAEPAAPPVGMPAIYGKGGKVDLKKATAFMRVLQAEWKTVGPAPKERSEQLWQRFKISGDEVYHRTHTGFEKLGESRGENLKLKEELCEKVEALVAPFAGSTPGEGGEGDGSVSGNERAALWRATAEKIKALQEEWKRVGPVAKEQADVVWKRFRAACDQFFGQRKEVAGKASGERSENMKKLEELCARVETLADSPDFRRASTEIKAAQAEWRTVGPAPRGDSDRLWKRFRAACDRFFNRRTTQFAEQDGERTSNLEKKTKLCERAEALVERAREGDRDAAMKEAKQLQAEWKKAGPVPHEHGDAIWRRFRAACDKVFTPEVEEAPPQPVASSEHGDPRTWPKFENKLPLAGVLAQLSGASAEEPVTDPADQPPKPVPLADA